MIRRSWEGPAMMEEDWETLTSFFPADWLGLAVRTGAVKKLRKDKSASNLLRVVLMHVVCGFSLRETAVRAREAHLADLSDVAIMKRLRKCREWLRALCVSLFNERGLALGEAEGPQFRLVDATNVKEPGKTGSLWRIHYSLRVPALVCDFFRLTETSGAGTGESLSRFPINAGDHVIADRGYSQAPGIHFAASHRAFVLVRLNAQSLPLLEEEGRAFDLIGRLRAVTAGVAAWWPVRIPGPDGALLPGRVCAVRKSEEAIRRAHKRLRRRASKKGHALRPETLVLAEYVVVVTTFPEDRFSPSEVLEWYRVRWQIELLFKRFKQIAQLGHLPKRDPDSAKGWLYGKLFAALVTEKIVRHAVSVSPWGYHLPTAAAAQSVA